MSIEKIVPQGLSDAMANAKEFTIQPDENSRARGCKPGPCLPCTPVCNPCKPPPPRCNQGGI